MKRYNIYELFVVEIQSDYDCDKNYFICKYNPSKKEYIEIFTNEKIKIADNSRVEPLTDYYSILETCNYTTRKPSMLDKKELLRKLIRINVFQSKENTIKINDTLGQSRVLKK